MVLTDKILHFAIFFGGMLVWSLIKGAFDLFASKFWKTVEREIHEKTADAA